MAFCVFCGKRLLAVQHPAAVRWIIFLNPLGDDAGGDQGLVFSQHKSGGLFVGIATADKEQCFQYHFWIGLFLIAVQVGEFAQAAVAFIELFDAALQTACSRLDHIG